MASLRPLLLVLALALGAPWAHAAEVIYPPGSRLGIVPPSGMVTSNNFLGFEDPDTNAAIILSSLPPETYAELEKTISAEALKRQGVTLEKREAMSLPTGKAFLVIGRQEVDKTKVRKWILIGSSPALTALVTVQIPQTVKNPYSDAAIREALATLAIRTTVPVEEQLSLLPFKIADFAGFRVGGVVLGRAVILSDAPAEMPAQSHTNIVVSVAPGGPAQTNDRDAFARDLFATISNVRDVRVVSSESLRIVGQPGHQILAQARDPAGTTILTVVQWLRFGGGGYLQLIGIARADAWHEAYPRFRAVRDGIDPR
jgi:hypothetical protein